MPAVRVALFCAITFVCTLCTIPQPIQGSSPAVSGDRNLTQAARASRRYLELLLHAYGEGGSIGLEGLQHLLLDMSQHMTHDHHPEDKHVDHDHTGHRHRSGGGHVDGPGSGAHSDHDHEDHASHRIAHDDHDHGAEPDHERSEHDGGDHHGEHADHGHHQRVPNDHESGLAPRDGAAESDTLSSRPDGKTELEAGHQPSGLTQPRSFQDRLKRALQHTDVDAGTAFETTAHERLCPALPELLSEFVLQPDAKLSASSLTLLCPALVYRVSVAGCQEPRGVEHEHGPEAHRPTLDSTSQANLWLFASLAVFCISLCGLAGVAVVPIMQRVVYRQLLQFLVALAVGTLAGDALLHLLPHALAPHRVHVEHRDHPADDHGEDHGPGELDAVLKGMVALVSLLFFFVAERAIGILHATCTRKKTQKIQKRLAGMRHLDRETTEMIGQRISSYRHSAGASHCFADSDTRDVLARLNGLNDSHGSCDEDKEHEGGKGTPAVDEALVAPLATSEGLTPTANISNDKLVHRPTHPSTKTADIGDSSEGLARESCERFSANERVDHSGDFTVIIHEHEHRHHGHTHTHGHIHQPPGSAGAVAGMVIVGDGLHNFTDGMAIGAAFAAGLASGLSTSVAVFCHELPHEIGDFAVLLQSGMSVRQALFYNVLSSVLCLAGMVLGLLLGNLEAFSSWVFAAAAGSFIYIALVDMIPELTASGAAPDGTSPCGLLTVQVLGMCCGAGIMLAIAIYEHELHSLVAVL